MKTRVLGNWLPILLVAATAIEGWLTLGAFTQSSLMVAAALKGLRERIDMALGRASNAK